VNTIINKAIEVLKSGGIILYPTDTIWGLGCDATNATAVEKIFKIKQRSESKSLIILVNDEAKINRYIKHMPDVAWDIIEFSNKPTTVILDGAVNLAKNVIAEDGSVGIRLCKHPFCSELIKRFGKAIVSTSANVSGEESPKSFHNINNEIKNSVDYIIDLPEFYESKNPPSSIIKISENFEIKILRK